MSLNHSPQTWHNSNHICLKYQHIGGSKGGVCVYIYGHKFFPQIFLFMHLFQIFFESHLYQWMHKCIVTDTCMNIPCSDLIDWGGIHPSTVQGMGYTCTQYLLHTLN